MALTPYPVLFGAVAFTDPLLIFFWLAACYAALNGRWGWSGVALGLAFATKQQALVLAPLVIGLGLGKRRRAGISFVLGVGFVLMFVLVWDIVRRADGAAMGFWGQGVDSYGGLRLIWPGELAPRLRGWVRLAGYCFGWPWLGALFLGGVGALLGYDLTHGRQTRSAAVDLILIAFVLFYLFFHLLVAFPVWDRYLLPLTPVSALLVGRMATIHASRFPLGLLTLQAKRRRAASAKRPFGAAQRIGITFYVLLATLLVGSGLMAAGGQIPVGGDHGAYDGLKEVLDYVRALPVGTVLYDRWLSWHYDYYLFDAYLYRAGFPTPEWLATDAAAHYDGKPRYLVVPGWESAARLERTLAEVDLVMSPTLTTRRRDGSVSFVVYEIKAGGRDER